MTCCAMSYHGVLCCAVQEERETLREQLCAVPAEADPTGIAINVAKVSSVGCLSPCCGFMS